MILLILALQAISPPPPIIDAPPSMPLVVAVAPQNLIAVPAVPSPLAGQAASVNLPVVAAKDPWAILPCGGTKTHLVC